jgi:hypothetical protein
MNATPKAKVSGGCLCGSVRFAARPHGREFGACHCSICRRWTAGPFLAVECDTFALDSDVSLGVYRSSEWAERGFCKTCGTPLFYRLIGRDFHAVSLEALDDRDGFAFTGQVFIDEKPAYYDFANKTHNMTGAEVFSTFLPPEASQAKE